MPATFGEDEVSRLRGALSRTVRELDRHGSEEGVTRTELTVLGTIFRQEAVRLAELAEIEGINPTMLSRIIGKLETLGLLERVPDEADRRSARARITPAGIRLWEHSRKARTAALGDLIDGLPEQEMTALLAALHALEALAELARPSRPKTAAP